jgi:hypothetical protein
VIPYDASVASLLQPERTETVFAPDRSYSTTQIGVEMAHLAYFHLGANALPRLERALALAGFKLVMPFSAPLDTQAFLARRDDGAAVVSFRGTQPASLQDIGVDLAFDLVAWSGKGRVHRGFRDAFEAVRPAIDDALRSHAIQRERLTVCGHSLGGALATLAAAAWAPAHLVTIGSPRVGDSAFAASVSGPACERIFNCCDAVARVPPRVEYDHVGPSFFIDAGGRPMPNPGGQRIDEERHIGRAQFYLRHAGLGKVPVRDLADHAPVNYLRAYFP